MSTTHRIPRNTRRPLDFPIPVPDRTSGKSDFHKTGAMIDRLMELQGQPLEPLQPAMDAEAAGVVIGSGPSQADLRPIRTRPGRKASRPAKTAQKGTQATTEAGMEATPAVVSPVPPSDATQEERKGDSVATEPTNERELEEVSGGIVLDSDTFDVTHHDGRVSVFNPATNGHRTFKVETVHNESSPFYGKRIVSLLVGPNNGDDFKGFGFADKDGVRVWRRFQGTDNGIWEKYASMLLHPQAWARKGLKYYVEARCRRCGRRLTTPASVSTGLGAYCAEVMGVAHEVAED